MKIKCWFTTGACGKADISVASAFDNKNSFILSLVLILAAGILLHFSSETFQSAFAEQSSVQVLPDKTQASGNLYFRSISESMSVTTMYVGGSNFPMSYHRTIAESMSVSTVQGKAPNSYTRSISEQASISTGMPSSPPPASQPARASPLPYSATSNQRIDERISPTLKILGKRTDITTKNTIGGTPFIAIPTVGSAYNGPPDQLSEITEISGQDGDPDDNSITLAQQLAAFNDYTLMQQSIENAALANVSVSAILLAGAAGVIITRQPTISGGRLQRRVYAVFLLKHSARENAVSQKTGNALFGHALLFFVVIIAVPPLAVSTLPSSAQQYDDTVEKSVIEILSASHLDVDMRFVSDIFKESKELDGIWSEEIPDGHNVRITFEQKLTSSRDITVFIRTLTGQPRIEVYEKEGTEIVAEFKYLVNNEYNKVFLTNLQNPQDTFDLHVIGGSVQFDHIVDPWPVPTYVGAGSGASGTGTISPALPLTSNLQTNDILLLFIETDNDAVSVSNQNGGTWAAVTNSPQGTGSPGGPQGVDGSATRLTVFWSRYNGSQQAPAISNSGNHMLAIILAFRGVITTGNPWDVTSGNVEGSDNSLSATGATTAVANTLVVVAAALHTDESSFGTTWMNSDLTNIILRADVLTTEGNDGRLGIITGEKVTAGTYGATTNTLSANAIKGMMTIALSPPAPVAPTLSISQPDGTSDTVTRGDPYNITYTLSDPDDVATAAFFYDTNNSGLDGTAISGACATAAEGTGITCQWDTATASPGTYYVYGIANDGTNPAVSAYSPGQITINGVINSRSVNEQMAVQDTVSTIIPRGISEQLGIIDLIGAENTIPRSLTEQVNLKERIHRSLNGYSGGTVYRSDTGEHGLNSVKYRQWDPTDAIWSPEVELPNTGSPIRNAKIAFSPTNEMRVVVSHGADGTLNLFRCDAVCIDKSSWTLVAADFADTHEDNADPNPDPMEPHKFFDIAFEQQSGHLLIVYDRDVSEANDFYYRSYDGSSLSAVSGFNYVAPSGVLDDEVIPFFHLASKPNSDEMALVLMEYTRQLAYAIVFDASTGTPSTSTRVALSSGMGSTSIEGDPIGVAYEPGSGRAVAFAARSTDLMAYSIWSGSSWSSVSTVDSNPSASGHDIMFMTVKAILSATSDLVMICQVDDLLDLTCVEMENGVLGSFSVRDSDVNTSSSKAFDFVWNNVGSSGTLVWGTSAGMVNTEVWNGLSWSLPSTTASSGIHSWIIAHQAPSPADVTQALFLTKNTDNDIGSLRIAGSTVSLIGDDTHTTNANSILFEGMSIDWHFAGIRQPFRLPADTLSLTDSVRASITKFRIESLSLTESVKPTPIKPLLENFALSETISRSVVKFISEQINMADALSIARTETLTDAIILTDAVAWSTTTFRSALEELIITESIRVSILKELTDGLAASDAIITVDLTSMAETFAMLDTLASSTFIARAVSEDLTIVDSSTSSSPAIIVTIAELMSITDNFVDISASFSLNLVQNIFLVHGFANDFSGVFSQVYGEGIVVGDSVVLVADSSTSLSEMMALQDELAVFFQASGSSMAESIQASDSVIMLVVRPPPLPPAAVTTMPNIMITETKNVDKFEGLIDPMQAMPVNGDWDVSGLDKDGLETLLQDIGMPVYDIEEEAVSGDIDELTMVLPTFWVSMKGSAANDAAFLTPVLSTMPAGAEVIIPINIEASLDEDSNSDMPTNVTVRFTTAESSTNFAMLITILDNNPEEDITQEPPPNDLPAFFIDVTIVGDFTSLSPDSPGFFEELPELTFMLTEEWAIEQSVEKDSNDVPIISLFLLDESDGTWIELTDEVEPPTSAIDGTYTYTATLPHFSTYVVTINTIILEEPSDGDGNAPSSGGGGGGGGTPIVNPTEPVSRPSNPGIPSENKIVIKDITDSFALSMVEQNPLPQRVITVQNVTVAVSLVDIQASGIGTAIATLNFEITNRNSAEEQLVLRYWYSDQSTGENIYEGKQQVSIGADSSITISVGIPFFSEGVFDLMIEAKSDDSTLASTDIVVSVPWLAVYLYIMVAIAAVIVAVSTFYILFAIRRRNRSDDKDEEH